MTEPPVTMSLRDEDLEDILDSPLDTKLPTDTVAVERAVKDVTTFSLRSNCGIQRDGMIYLSIKSRRSEE